METSRHVTALETVEKLAKLSAARVAATSPRQRARVTYVDGRHEVELRREGFQRLDPEVLAAEVVDAFNGTLRGFRQAERKVVAEYRSTREPVAPPPRPDVDALRRDLAAVSVSAVSPARLARGRWSAVDGVSLSIEAVNESHREPLAADLSALLNELSEKYRVELRRVTDAAHREARGSA